MKAGDIVVVQIPQETKDILASLGGDVDYLREHGELEVLSVDEENDSVFISDGYSGRDCYSLVPDKHGLSCASFFVLKGE